jgi:hypothetical protein
MLAMSVVGIERKAWELAVVMGVLAGLAAMALMWVALFVDPVKLGTGVVGHGAQGGVYLPGRAAITMFGHWAAAGVGMAAAWHRDAAYLAGWGMVAAFTMRAWAVVATGGLVAVIVFIDRYRVAPMILPGMKHVRGLRLREGAEGVHYANKGFQRLLRAKGPGIALAPGVTLPFNREVQGFSLTGAPGSGKTVIYRWMIDQILDRQHRMMALLRDGVALDKLPSIPDKLIVVDAGKGDFTEAWPDNEFMLLAPHDTGKRTVKHSDGREEEITIGYAWDIGKDIQGLPAAIDFSKSMIADTDEPVWGEGARAINTGLLRSLQETYGTAWGWTEYRSALGLLSRPRELKQCMEVHYPIASQFVLLGQGNTFSKQSEGYIANISAVIGVLVDSIYRAWGENVELPRISLVGWMLDDNPQKKAIILQRSGEVATISQVWIGAALKTMARVTTSPRLSDNSKRRIWLLFDEAPQFITKGDGLLQIVEVGRSRGLCAVWGAQTAEQYEERWSQNQANTLQNMVQNKFICQTPAGPGAEYVAEKLIGTSDWLVRDDNRSGGGGKGSSGWSRSWKEQRRLVVLANYLAGKIGDMGDGIAALFIGPADVSNLKFPYPSHWVKRREGSITAEWVRTNEPM